MTKFTAERILVRLYDRTLYTQTRLTIHQLTFEVTVLILGGLRRLRPRLNFSTILYKASHSTGLVHLELIIASSALIFQHRHLLELLRQIQNEPHTPFPRHQIQGPTQEDTQIQPSIHHLTSHNSTDILGDVRFKRVLRYYYSGSR